MGKVQLNFRSPRWQHDRTTIAFAIWRGQNLIHLLFFNLAVYLYPGDGNPISATSQMLQRWAQTLSNFHMTNENWEIIRKNAALGLQKATIYKSFVQERLYKISSIDDDRIIIDRVSGGHPAHFTKGEATGAIETLKAKKRIKKGDLLHSVVREVMLVYLHPSVHWDSNSHEVYWNSDLPLSVVPTLKFISQASDDDLEKIQIFINKRKNQSKFRHVMLSLYNNKCAISGMGPKNVLDAAHITCHSLTGKNTNDNGILLRSDLHALFDDNLLLIHPNKLTVHLHNTLRLSYYSKYEGIKIADRADQSKPSKEYLKEKWNNAMWAKSFE